MNQVHDNTGRSERYVDSSNLEPLAGYLEPRFGNIYDDNFQGEGASLKFQGWTAELRATVRQYLVHEMTDDDYGALLDELLYGVSDGSREVQADFIIGHHEAWEIAYACHLVAVKAVPSPTELIGTQSHTWESEDQQVDVAHWLQAHADYAQLKAMASFARLNSSVITDDVSPDSDEACFAAVDLAVQLPKAMSPQGAVAAWENVVGPASTDLTDDEWALLRPLTPKSKNTSPPDTVRQALNGMLYRHAHQSERRKFPIRYGDKFAVSTRAQSYKKTGAFAHMLTGLEGKPEAERLVTWLCEVLDGR